MQAFESFIGSVMKCANCSGSVQRPQLQHELRRDEHLNHPRHSTKHIMISNFFFTTEFYVTVPLVARRP